MKPQQENPTPDIIILALSRWDNPYSSTAVSLAREFSKKTRVFYIDNPYTLKDLLFSGKNEQVRRGTSSWFRRRIYRALGTGDQSLTALAVPPLLSINFLPAGPLYNLLSRINDWILFRAIKKMMRDFKIHNFILINIFNPFYGRYFPKFFKPRLFIYYTMDDIAQSLYVRKHGARLEHEAMKKADFTLATSLELKNMASRKSTFVHYLPNAVDHSVFLKESHASSQRPEEFKTINNQVIIFIGNCDHRLDYDILEKMLISHKEKTFVMVGPHSVEKNVIDRLRTFPNAVILGRRPQTELPGYMAHAHCLIIPYKCNTLTKSIYPLKLNEYLASGIPVVSTPFSEDVLGFSSVVMLSESPDDFCSKISIAISEDDEVKRQERKRVASQNRWEDRANEFWKLVESYLSQRDSC